MTAQSLLVLQVVVQATHYQQQAQVHLVALKLMVQLLQLMAVVLLVQLVADQAAVLASAMLARI